MPSGSAMARSPSNAPDCSIPRLASRSNETHADRTVRINPDNRRPLGDARYAELGVEHVMFQCEPYVDESIRRLTRAPHLYRAA